MLKELIGLLYPKDYLQPRFAAVAGAVAAVAGAAISADASRSASNKQADAARDANALTATQADQARADQKPWMDRGNEAGNRLQYLMGLSPYGGGSGQMASGGLAPGQMTREQLTAQLTPGYTSYSSSQAEQDYLNAAKSMGYELPQYKLDGFDPVQTVDETGLNAAIDARLSQQSQQQAEAAKSDPAYGSLMRNFSTADLNADPVYQSGLQFGLDEGRKGINNQAAATGSMLSGATLKALTRYGNDYGSTKANESYNRFNVNQNNQYNRLAGISGTGQTTANQVGSMGMGAATQMGKNMIGAGDARAASAIGTAGAFNNALGQGYNAYQQQQMMQNPYGNNLNKLSGSDFTGYDNSYSGDAMGSFFNGGY